MSKKYPRTYHLPCSPGASSDDKVLPDDKLFENRQIVATVKMDGENTTLTPTECHARSLDSRNHPSRNWVKGFWGSIKHRIPTGFRICGENLFAKHSIHYKSLPSYFMGFSVWDGDTCLAWDDTLDVFSDLGIVPVPALYIGPYTDYTIEVLLEFVDFDESEGFVIRHFDQFSYDNFKDSVAKYVRAGHVQSEEHWMHSQIIQNGLVVNEGL